MPPLLVYPFPLLANSGGGCWRSAISKRSHWLASNSQRTNPILYKLMNLQLLYTWPIATDIYESCKIQNCKNVGMSKNLIFVQWHITLGVRIWQHFFLPNCSDSVCLLSFPENEYKNSEFRTKMYLSENECTCLAFNHYLCRCCRGCMNPLSQLGLIYKDFGMLSSSV